MSVFINWGHRVALKEGADLEGTERHLRDDARLSPERVWLLVCSALLASIGLDTSSVAVIIGAMLISPLMGPILAIGFAAETNDRDLLLAALRELGLASAASLLVSALYFLLSPLAQPTPELLARIRPTLLDVGVALFGGIAGIVAASRRHPSLALPGVAIATALMPPLCTAGFGLATGRPTYFLGALYLYVINAIFIALATAGICRLLGMPKHSFPTEVARRRAHRWVLSIVIVAIIPSLYFLYRSAREVQERRRVERFIAAEVRAKTRDIIRWEFAADPGGRALRVYVAGAPMEPIVIDSVQKRIEDYDLAGVQLQVIQSGITAAALQRLRTDAVQGVLEALAHPERSGVDSSSNTRVRAVSREMAAAFPEITRVAVASIPNALDTSSVSSPELILEFRSGTPTTRQNQILTAARAFLAIRLGTDSLRIRPR